MNAKLTVRERFVWLGLLTAFWIFLALVFSTQMVLFGSFPWSVALRFAFRDWYPWILLSPLVLWITGRFPLEINLWRWSIPVHIVTCIISVCSSAILAKAVELTPFWMPDRPPPWASRQSGPDRHPLEAPRPGEKGRPGHPPEGAPDRPMGPRGRPRPAPFSFHNISMRAGFNLPVYFFIVSIGHAFTYFRRSRERERKTLELETRLAQAKLQALRMQLHPHFLFNTLHAISTLVHKDPAAADEMIGNLSELLRLAIEDTDQQEIPLRQELDFLDRYLEIQQMRFGDRLRVEKQIDQHVLAAQVPAMILQPLVENAIRHGIEPQVTAGIVSIVASRIDMRLALSVRDTGSGVKSGLNKPEREGIGLANTRARLQELYGVNYQLTLRNGPQGGFIAQLEIPYHEQPLFGTESTT